MRRPAAATMPTTDRAGSDSAPSRVARISCSVDGRRALPCPVSASTSSSMKKGLPSERRWKRDATMADGASPVMEASIAAVSSASRRARSIRLTRPVRSSSLIHGIAGCRRWSSSDRRVIATTTGSVRRDRTRNPRVSRVAGSAQWTSSTMTSTGADSDRRRSRPASASSRRAWRNSRWTWAADDDGSSAGTRRARSGPDVPTRARSSSGSMPRAISARISTMGPYGSPWSPTLAHEPRRTRTPRAVAAIASSPTSRVLPTPASPVISRCVTDPATAASSTPRAASSSVRRPIVMGLTRRVAMVAIIRTASR